MKLSLPQSSLFNQFYSLGRPARHFLVATALDGFALSMWMLFFNFYILALGFDREFLGQVNSVTAAAALALGLPLGLISDQVGRKKAMLLGTIIYLGAASLEIALKDPGLILLMAFLAGAGHTLYFLNKAPLIVQVSNPANRTSLFSMNFSLAYIAGVAGNLIAGQLFSLGAGFFRDSISIAGIYRLVLGASLSVSALMLIPLALIQIPGSGKGLIEPIPVSSRERLSALKSSLKDIFTRPIIWKLALVQVTCGMGSAVLVPFINLFLYEKFHLSGKALGLVFSLKSLVTGVGVMVGPALVMAAQSKVKAAVGTLAIGAGFLLLLGFSPILGVALVGFFLGGTLVNISVPLMDAFSMERVPESNHGTFCSIRELSWQGSWMVGPYLSGIIQTRAGFTPIFIGSVGFFLLSTALMGFFFRKTEQIPLRGIPSDS